MPAAPRFRSVRLQAGLIVGVVLALVGVGAAPAFAADPVFAEGDCVVYRLSDNGPGGAQCAGVDLSGTRFGEGDFRGAALTGANFAGGDVQGAKFDGAVLDGADFSATRVVGADFTNSSILPGTIDVTADASGQAPVEFAANLPTGLTLDGCSIVGTPVESGQAFPIGTSNIFCQLSTTFAGNDPGTAQAVITVNVTASPTAPATSDPIFTAVAETPDAQSGSGETPNTLMIGGFIGGGLLVVLGIVAFILANRKGRKA
ncbi:pentapeptide repeat-containing protein [Herbiconiux ginsengi]|uniref:Pentapeptide repeat-containing protein n=1 Tax=Herbiconiux ginsengi TaxID=381665 RepID=A0A1H3TS50_9MICO|nr:pentapeptide repeat-containing protein [Herbiconiux ginsengi]SDZ53062.1 Pentapeptide repeat-containing protein [Herbiconiux ginsengi]